MDLSDALFILAFVCLVVGVSVLSGLVFGAVYAIPGALLPLAGVLGFVGYVIGRVKSGGG